MKKLQKCSFCGNTIRFDELEYIDADIGQMCKNCYQWMHNEFLRILREARECQ